MQILIFLLQTFSLFYNYFFFLHDSTSCPDISHIYIQKQGWHKIAIPMMVVWFGWMIYEMTGILGIEGPMAIGFITGAAVGGVIGGILGFRINRKIVRKTGEILEQIEELQRES